MFIYIALPTQVFYISKGRLKPANRQFNNTNNDYELSLNEDTEVELVSYEGSMEISKSPPYGSSLYLAKCCPPVLDNSPLVPPFFHSLIFLPAFLLSLFYHLFPFPFSSLSSFSLCFCSPPIPSHFFPIFLLFCALPPNSFRTSPFHLPPPPVLTSALTQHRNPPFPPFSTTSDQYLRSSRLSLTP